MKLQFLLELNMNLFVSELILLLLAASQAQATSDPENGEQIPEITQTSDLSLRILNSNNDTGEFLLEGDIQVPQAPTVMECWYKSCRWPKGLDGKVSVSYTLSSDFELYDRQLIFFALKDIESKTCIRFVPRQCESVKDYISVESRAGCFSSVGRQGGKQVLSLNRRTCVSRGIIQHQLLHALGFKHEHTRSDRDKYVRINWDNMDRDQAYNFYRSFNNVDTPYDYDSIMHYGRTAFSNNGGDTITPLSSKQVNIGLNQEMSNWDIKKIKLYYDC